MNAIELKAIVNYLIESYCDNVNGDFKHDISDKDVNMNCVTLTEKLMAVNFYYDRVIDAAGCISKRDIESFTWDGSEKLTMLETYVNEALDRIYKAELIDNRKDDPTIG